MINATGYEERYYFPASFPSPPHMLTYSQTHTWQLNKILKGPCLPLVYFGVGGDYSLRLYPPFPPPKMFLIYKHSQLFGWEEGGDISPTPEMS